MRKQGLLKRRFIMGTTVEQKNNSLYTDEAGKFYQGMTRKDASNIHSWGEGIFSKKNAALEEFIRIDKDWDGVLSKDEISAELDNNIEKKRKTINAQIGIGLLDVFIATKSKSPKTWLIAAGITGLISLHEFLDKRKLQARLAQGHN